jgi:hypothetical protein
MKDVHDRKLRRSFGKRKMYTEAFLLGDRCKNGNVKGRRKGVVCFTVLHILHISSKYHNWNGAII